MPLELFVDETGKNRFRITARNGNILATSESYEGGQGKAIRGYNALQKEMLRLEQEERDAVSQKVHGI